MARTSAKKKDEFLLPKRERGIFLGGQKWAKLDLATRPNLKALSATLPEGDAQRGVFRAAGNRPDGTLVNAMSGRVSAGAGIRPTATGNLATGLRTGAQAGRPGVARPIAPAKRALTLSERKARINPVNPLGKSMTQREARDRKNSFDRTGIAAKRWQKIIADEKKQASTILEERHAAEAGTLEYERKREAEGQKIEGRVGLAEVKGGIKEKLQGLEGEQRQAVLTVEFKNDMEKFGITQAAKDAGREDDQVFQLEKLAERYKLAGENATTDDERDQADRLEFEALRAANDARKKTVTDPIFGATTIEFGEPNAPTDTGATQAPEDLQSGATDQEQKAWDMVRSTDPFTLSDQGEAALYQQWADYFRTKYNLDVKKFRPKESPANA